MARRVIIAQPIAGVEGLVSTVELGSAPFALMVEFEPQRRSLFGKISYRVKMQIKLRDEKVLSLISKHKLLGTVVYSDGAMEDIVRQQSELLEQLEASAAELNAAGVLVASWKLGGRKLAGARAIEITFERLLHVVEIEGSSTDEVSFIAFQVRSNIDRLAAKIAAAGSFEGGGEVRVYLPGEKAKPVKNKTGTPPSTWGR